MEILMEQDKINKIKTLHKEGKKNSEIAKLLNISNQLVSYYNNKKEILKRQIERFRKKPLKERQRIYKERLPYIRNYLNNKYKTNKEFREKEKQRSKNYYKLKGGHIDI
jgi:predicted transcriptional regulator